MQGNPFLDIEVSVALARRVHARFRRCWHNATMAVSHLGRRARYVEGWVVTHRSDPYVIEHGWCEVDGRIIDPSYAPHVSPYPPPVAYFAGLRFNVAEAEAALCGRRLPIAWSHETDAYRRAFDAAWLAATLRQHPTPAPPARIVHLRREPCDVIIARPSPWASPFFFGRDGKRDPVIAKYRRWLIRQPGLLCDVWSLRGKVLGCHCAPHACHGDVLVELANVGLGGAPVEHSAVLPGRARATAPPAYEPVVQLSVPARQYAPFNGSNGARIESALD